MFKLVDHASGLQDFAPGGVKLAPDVPGSTSFAEEAIRIRGVERFAKVSVFSHVIFVDVQGSELHDCAEHLDGCTCVHVHVRVQCSHRTSVFLFQKRNFTSNRRSTRASVC